MSWKETVSEFVVLLFGAISFCVVMGYADSIDAWLLR
jgi:hypothetical protein